MKVQQATADQTPAIGMQPLERAAWALTGVCYAALVVGSFLPQRDLPRFVFSYDKLCHFVVYAGLTLLAAVALCQRQSLESASRKFYRLAGLLAIGGFFLTTAGLSEVLQGAVGRRFDWWDFFFGALGIVAVLVPAVLTQAGCSTPLAAKRAGSA